MSRPGSPLGPYLPHPTREEAAAYTRDLGYEERLSATTIIKGVGTRFQDFYSMFQLAARLDTGENFMASGGGLDFMPGALAAWLRDVVGDTALASAVSHAESVLPVESVAQDAVAVMIKARVTQYREVLD